MSTVPAPTQAPGRLPVLGHLWPLLVNPLRFLSSLPAVADVVEIRVGRESMVVVCTPELTSQVLLNSSHAFDKGGAFYENMRSIIGNGIATCPATEHKRLRRLTQPAFRADRMARYAHAIGVQDQALTASWHDGQVLDVLPATRALAIRTALATVFSRSVLGDGLDELSRDVITFVNHQSLARTVMPSLNRLPTPANRRYRSAEVRLLARIDQAIATYRATGTDHGDLMSMFITDHSDDALTDREIRDTAITVLLGNVTASAVGHAWLLHHISRDPGLAAACAAEVRGVCGDRFPTTEDTQRLPTVRAVVAETLRLTTPSWIFTRIATTDTTLGGVHLAANTQILISPYTLHHRSDLFTDPQRFDPTRFTGRDPARTPGWIPFGAGARKCIGDEFAVMDLILTLAWIAAHWRLEPVSRRPVTAQPRLHLEPRGLRLRLHRRKL